MLDQNFKIDELLGCDRLFDDLAGDVRTESWGRQLHQQAAEVFDASTNGNLPRWMEAFAALPMISPEFVDVKTAAVTAGGTIDEAQLGALRQALTGLHPWRKGPFDLFGMQVDSEWRSDLKWQRVAPHIDLNNADILDIGCGNGYYGWRMLGAGAKRVVGLDPMLLYVIQAAAIRRYLGNLPNYILPGSDASIPTDLGTFDTVFSMGVLYHRASPIDHLNSLSEALVNKGQLVLETLVIDGAADQVLVPPARYAQMRNVWFLPSTGLLERWLSRCGFVDIRTVDVTPTTIEEQRSTDWMHFDSLVDFLDPDDPTRTIEGHPAPLRAIVIARKK